jgi:hypothetical protein
MRPERRLPRGLAAVSRESETEVINLESWVAAYVRAIARLESVQVPPQAGQEAA